MCKLVDDTDAIILPVTVIGELLYGALNSTKRKNNEKFVHQFAGYSLVMQIDESVAARYCPGFVWILSNGVIRFLKMVSGLRQPASFSNYPLSVGMIISD